MVSVCITINIQFFACERWSVVTEPILLIEQYCRVSYSIFVVIVGFEIRSKNSKGWICIPWILHALLSPTDYQCRHLQSHPGTPFIHYNDVKTSPMASQITSRTIVYSIVYSCADQRKHQSSASLAYVWGLHRVPVNSPHQWLGRWKCFHLMTSPCNMH